VLFVNILVVDDELVSREKLARLIQGLNHDMLVASDGDEAWEIWESRRPRLVITDWNMPGIKGPELCRKIRASEGSRYTYLIIVTSRDASTDIVEGMNAGADDFVSKPFVKEELAVRIRAGERILGFESRELVIFSMAKLAESRDPDMGDHLERIRFYSKALAEAIARSNNPPQEMNRLFIDNIFLTSPLHDIGKTGIPDHVLLKQGRLNHDEFELMKKHSNIGFEAIAHSLEKHPGAEYLSMSAEIALNHHEKFDGTGYPAGLSGTDIPLSARIVALADVYDALVSKRVYKEADTHQMAKAIIIDGRAHILILWW
jgi:putative two-component system response regulator